jgi:hypothetical protein
VKKSLKLIAITILLSPLLVVGMVAGAIVFSLQAGYLFADDYLGKLIE